MQNINLKGNEDDGIYDKWIKQINHKCFLSQKCEVFFKSFSDHFICFLFK